MCLLIIKQGMQQMLDETQADSANMRRMYVGLGDRIAEVMRSHRSREAPGQQAADGNQVGQCNISLQGKSTKLRSVRRLM